jgi:serine/threonine protein kinase
MPEIEGYAVERIIGRGASATVYLARELRIARPVALKVLRPEYAESLHAARFLQEIQIIANLTHPHIVPLYNAGQSGDSLYYAMTYVPGESLRSRIEREKTLPIRDAISIVEEVASALSYAHSENIVHRDIKPENILLSHGKAVVADFGIARALTLAGDPNFTQPGVAIGTTSYMSPEQCSSEAIDGRSDIYSLGCVFFELLTGAPPFVGATKTETFAQHIGAEIPSVRAARPEVSAALDAVVRKALAKEPRDRFETAKEFGDELAAVVSGAHAVVSVPVPDIEPVSVPPDSVPAPPPKPSVLWDHPFAIALVTLALVGGVAWSAVDWPTSRDGRVTPALAASVSHDPSIDTTRYVLVPDDSGASSMVSQRLEETLGSWTGLSVVDGAAVQEVRAQRRPGERTPPDPHSVALALNAGRYLRVGATGSGDSVGVRAELYDTRRNARLTEERVVISRRGGARADAELAALADSLLFRNRVADAEPGSIIGTRSLPARQAYFAARAAIDEWNLAAADSFLSAATKFDPHYARALLWLAQIRTWIGDPVVRWRFAAERAASSRNALEGGELVLARALVSTARGDLPQACQTLRTLSEQHPTSYALWYSLGGCLRSDFVVVRDSQSPSHWRFRTSYRAALAAYEKAFVQLPAIHRSFQGRAFAEMRSLLMTSTMSVRGGRALAPDTLQFQAYPTWLDDTLAFVPYPENEFAAGRAKTRPADVSTAIREQRKRFYDLASMWRAASPDSPDAMEAVAVALDLLGNPAARDSLTLARRLAVEDDDRFRLAALEVWMRVKLSSGTDTAGIRAAWRLADSLLGTHKARDRSEAQLAASLAALLGRANLAAALNRDSEARKTSPAIAQYAPALLAFAAMGGPVDSLRALEPLLDAAIRRGVPSAEQRDARSRWLYRSAFLSAPEYRFANIQSPSSGSFGATLYAAWRDRDLPRAQEALRDRAENRRAGFVRASDISMDVLYQEAAVLSALGDERGALAWLAPTLDSLALAEPLAFAEVAQAGPLIRAMALRARLAAAAGDMRAARAWANTVMVLWSKPDDFLNSTVSRLRQLTR